MSQDDWLRQLHPVSNPRAKSGHFGASQACMCKGTWQCVCLFVCISVCPSARPNNPWLVSSLSYSWLRFIYLWLQLGLSCIFPSLNFLTEWLIVLLHISLRQISSENSFHICSDLTFEQSKHSKRLVHCFFTVFRRTLVAADQRSRSSSAENSHLAVGQPQHCSQGWLHTSRYIPRRIFPCLLPQSFVQGQNIWWTSLHLPLKMCHTLVFWNFNKKKLQGIPFQDWFWQEDSQQLDPKTSTSHMCRATALLRGKFTDTYLPATPRGQLNILVSPRPRASSW